MYQIFNSVMPHIIRLGLCIMDWLMDVKSLVMKVIGMFFLRYVYFADNFLGIKSTRVLEASGDVSGNLTNVIRLYYHRDEYQSVDSLYRWLRRYRFNDNVVRLIYIVDGAVRLSDVNINDYKELNTGKEVLSMDLTKLEGLSIQSQGKFESRTPTAACKEKASVAEERASACKERTSARKEMASADEEKAAAAEEKDEAGEEKAPAAEEKPKAD